MKHVKNYFGSKLQLNRKEQEIQFKKNVHDIMTNTRYILDNLDSFPIYSVNWITYSTGKGNKPRWKKNPIYKKQNQNNDFLFNCSNFNQTAWLYSQK